MDVALGVFVESTGARIALIDAAPPNALIDESEIDLRTEPIESLVNTLVSTDQALGNSGHQLVATNLCSADAEQITRLRELLAGADLRDVSVVSAADAVAAATQTLAAGQTVATLMNDGATAALSVVPPGSSPTSPIATQPVSDGDATTAYQALLRQFSSDPGAATSVIVLGSFDTDGLPDLLSETSPVPLLHVDDPEAALARGAALAGFAREATTLSPVADATMASPVTSPVGPADGPATAATPVEHADTVQGQKLAYSEVPDGADVLPDFPSGATDFDIDFDDDRTEIVDAADDDESLRRRQVLIGSSVASLAAVGVATLAVSVAITVTPTATEQAIRLQDEAVPGNAFPLAPGQGVEPDGETWTMVEQLPAPGAAVDNEFRTFRTQALRTTAAETAAPALVNVYRDGTVGLAAAPAAPAAPTAPLPLDPGVVAPVFPELPAYVTRLIPDFSKVSLIEVLNYVANLLPLSPLAPAQWSTTLDAATPLSDIGVLAVVPKSQGALFSTPTSVLAGDDISAIPQGLFETDLSAADKTALLPTGSAVVSELPTELADQEPSQILSEVLTNPGLLSNAPDLPAPVAEVLESEAIQSGDPVLPLTPGEIGAEPESSEPVGEPGEDSEGPSERRPDDATDPGGTAEQEPADEPAGEESADDEAVVDEPGEEPTTGETRQTATPTPSPTTTRAPARTTQPEATTQPEVTRQPEVAVEPDVAERPEATAEAPQPTAQTAPTVEQAPPVRQAEPAPAYTPEPTPAYTPEPAPAYTAPPAPAYTPPAPAPAPEPAPAVTLPTLPQLPLDGLFGSGEE